MGIFQKNGQYYIDYRYKGRRIREKAGTNRRAAENALAVRRAEILQGRYQIKQQSNLTFSEFSVVYMEYAKANKRSWLRDQVSLVHLVPEFGAMKLSEVSAHSMEEYKIKRLRAVKPATVNRELILVKRMFNLAIAWGKATSNPMKGVRLLREANMQERILTKDEIARLLAACSDYFRPIVLTALHTGMRRGEILGLKWSQVDLEYRVITILFSKSGRVRKIPINSTLFETLKAMKEKASSEFVFICRRTKCPAGNIQNAWLTAIRKSGIIRCRFHDLRHTFASHLVASGVDIVTVKELLGHADIKMTMRYAHSAPELKVKAVTVLESSINETRGHYLDTKPKKAETVADLTY